MFTKLVCEKLESEKQMSNSDIAEILVREHSTGDPKKNDNIRRRVYDALSVIQAIGLAEKHGKVYVWVGRPSISSTSEDKPMLSRMERIV
ncbi:uncharacterized protein [Blastocystis hominis]|uniref:E2F/DP family winged-helix DNA-binding domain-containing protein n=1 Tax=Blastocystis hominis TaxID=12968 RepID=D8M7B2_BLAHO|nr:uncharacterized protein [Blastocystis hominis]CBK23951.2 unnamed protein product [Blastocystis hominis]|eukprot:XP_012897999.1 uncharacterized protein [Blastocystis hominis]